MAQAWRSTTVGTTPTSPMSINKPAGVVDGDILVFSGMGDTSGTFTKPADWTALHNQVSGSMRLQVWWKVAAGEPGSYSFGFITHSAAIGVMSAISGVRGVLDGSSIKTNVSASAMTGTAYIGVDPNVVLLWTGARFTVSASGDIQKPSKHTKRNPSDVYAGGSILSPTLIHATEIFAGGGAAMVAGDTNGSLTGGNTATNMVSLVSFLNALPDAQPLLFCEA
jgi:hypothetical protein